MKRVLFVASLMMGGACSSPSTAPAVAPAAAKPAAPAAKTYGQAIGASKAVELTTVLAAPEQYAGQSLVTQGQVRAACSKKGCWMELAPSKEASAPGARVTFKDYGFFVPTNSAGKIARVEATIEVKTIGKDEVAHMEGEGGTVKNKQPDGTAKEVRMVATGVELSDS